MKRIKVRSWPALLGLLALALTSLGVTLTERRAAAETSGLSGLADVSGTVTSAKPFKAAKVYLRNTDRRILYMVYTNAGHFQAMHLFPGNYEFTIKAVGLSSDTKKIVLKAGKNSPLDTTLQEASGNAAAAEAVSFDAIYPPGPERTLVENTCMDCHGPSFIPAHQWDLDEWTAAIDLMTKEGNVRFNDSDRAMLLAWLAKNFGPDSKPRTVKFDTEMPVDEAKTSKAMYMEYYIEPHPAGLGGGVMGQDPHFDKDGNVWFTDRGNPPRVGRLDPRTGEMKTWNMPGKGSVHGITIDENGIVWLPETDGGRHVNAFDPKTEKFERWDVDPDGTLSKQNRRALSIHTPVLDSKQNVWITLIQGDSLVKWDRETREIKVYPTATKPSGPYGIDVDNKDNVWIAESHGEARIAKFDPATEKWTEYPSPTPGRIRRLRADSKGNVWYGLFSGGKIGRLDVSSGKIEEFAIPQEFSQPYDILPDSHNNVWFSDGGQGGALIRFDESSHTFTYFPTPQVTDQPRIEMTRDGAIWYCPRSSREAGVGVLYPDMTKMTTLAAYYAPRESGQPKSKSHEAR